MKNILQNLDSKISCTIDGWTSLSNTCFYGITAHYVDENFKLYSLVLDFIPASGGHTGQDIATIFFNVLTDFGIEKKLQGITVDNVASNTTFVYELQTLMNVNNISFDPESQHFRCFGHIINLGRYLLVKYI